MGHKVASDTLGSDQLSCLEMCGRAVRGGVETGQIGIQRSNPFSFVAVCTTTIYLSRSGPTTWHCHSQAFTTFLEGPCCVSPVS